MSKWAAQVRTEYPKLGIFGETLVSSVLNQAYFTEGKTISQQIDTHLPGITDAQIKDAIYDLLEGKTDAGAAGGINRLYATLANDFVYKNAMNNCVFLDNHDMHRMYSLVGEDMGKYKSAIALLFTTRGIPQLYYGTELLMKNMSKPDGLVREDVKGGWLGDSVNKFTPQGRTVKENEAFNFVRTLANYRKNNTVLQTGKLMQFVPDKGIYTFFRYNNEKTVMVVVNTNNREEKLATEHYAERMAKFSKAINIIDHTFINSLKELDLPAKATLVLELR
jgi:glycosidase